MTNASSVAIRKLVPPAAASLCGRTGIRASRSPLCFPNLLSSGSLPNCHHQTAFFSSSIPCIDDGAGQSPLILINRRNGVHDVGGLESLLGQQIDLSDPTLQDWEQETHALLVVLIQNGYLYTDELRRHIESMPTDHFVARSYYCKWATSMTLSLIERGVLNYTDLDRVLLGDNKNNNNISSSDTKSTGPAKPAFQVGQRVRVLSEQSMARWRKPHLRSPGYIFGVTGVVESIEGYFPDPSYKAFRSIIMPEGVLESAGGEERKEHLYRVRFQQEDVWPEGKELAKSNHASSDTVTVEIYENWLVDEETSDAPSWEIDPTNSLKETHHGRTEGHQHEQHHHHSHDHEHLPRAELEQRAIDLEVVSGMCGSGSISNSSEPTVVVGDRLSRALIELLSQPQHLGPDLRMKIRKVIDALESVKIRADGATLVVQAWTDPNFETRLLEDAASAALELGINTVNATAPTKLKVVKSFLPTTEEEGRRPGVHNLVTCTLCSCYPLSLLGLSPKWYKSRTYRARAVREPRAMLQDSFGLDLSPSEWTIRVHDSTADLRYLVLPPRPPNTEHWTDEELRRLVTRNTMIGVALPDGII